MALPVASDEVVIYISDGDAVIEQKLCPVENPQMVGLDDDDHLVSQHLGHGVHSQAEVVVRVDEGQFCCGIEVDESVAQQTWKLHLESDSLDECADESSLEASDLDSSRQCSEDSAITKVLKIPDDFGTSGQHLGAHPEGNKSIMSTQEVTGFDVDAMIFTLKDSKMVVMDDTSAGHLSDPGVYGWEDSPDESPALLNAFPMTVSPSVDLSMSVLLQNRDSQSFGACPPATSGGATEEVPGESSNGAYVVLMPATQMDNLCMVGYRSDYGEAWQPSHISLAIEAFDTKALTAPEAPGGPTEEGASVQGLKLQDLDGWKSMGSGSVISAQSRVEKWINNLQHYDIVDEDETVPGEVEMSLEREKRPSNSSYQITDVLAMDRALAKASMRSLCSSSSVAHITGLGLREMPLLGAFSSLKTLNLSANRIARIPAGCLPRSLHSLDLSRNKINLIEGFRDLTRLRILNLCCNRISRIGHGLANCTLIKELYVAGNKIAEVEGLHRLLKLSVLDLSYNKLATSKALGQLAANYSSLLAFNLLGNPVLVNLGEEQMRKMVLSLAPYVTYLNKLPIKAVSAREAVIDNIARAALGTSHRSSKSSTKASVRAAKSFSSHQKLPVPFRSKGGEKRFGSILPAHDSSSSLKPPRQQRHHHHLHADDSHHHNSKKGKESTRSSKTPLTLRENGLWNLALDSNSQAMHRSRSEGALEE